MMAALAVSVGATMAATMIESDQNATGDESKIGHSD
jgi:hypothetical protein